MRLLLPLLAVLWSGVAAAQTDKVWTDAPVPGVLPPGVAPADRAGSIAGADTATPFSGLPSGTRTGGQSSQTTRDTAIDADTVTPNLSR
ncbi:MAG: hypothetical protein H7Z10_04770 [Gemmatimonadaceae bacterium]|nr:hypothetical protein [Acetobacteraceae bacterium]